ncbi:MAG: hypothetical protein RQ758_00720 [Methanomicrobiaceae archaeon]|nr:hypothetical protein [Methanomicrobiaceae archaeon]
MMKKTIATIGMVLLCAMLIVAPALAAGPAAGGNGDGQDGQGQMAPGDGNGTQLQDQTRERQQLQNCTPGTACNATQLRQMMQEREQQLAGGAGQEVQKENRVRLAVHALKAAEPLTGPRGEEMVRIANQFNSSLQVTTRAEERIRNQNSVMRFLFGGNEDAAQEILREVEQNRNRIQETNRLIQECDCDPQTRAILQEQVRNIEQEQNRMRQLAQQEQEYRGLLGWIFR